MSTKRGRPFSENPKSDRLYIRVSPKEKEKIMGVCQQYGLTLLELIKKGIEAVEK